MLLIPVYYIINKHIIFQFVYSDDNGTIYSITRKKTKKDYQIQTQFLINIYGIKLKKFNDNILKQISYRLNS